MPFFCAFWGPKSMPVRTDFFGLKFFFEKVMQQLKKSVFLQPQIQGEMAEWSKARAWRARKRQKRFMGSNPILSARPKGLKINKVKII